MSKRRGKDIGMGHVDLVMNVPLQDVVSGLDLDSDQARQLILATDLRMESVEFTEEVIRALIASLRKDYEGTDWDPSELLRLAA